MRGTIKTLQPERGFGFIAPDDGGRDLFFHSSAVEGAAFEDLRPGQAVEFEPGEDPRNPGRQRADRVRAVEAG